AYRLLSITGHGTVTTRRSQSVHRLYGCVPPRIVERRSSATRLASLPPGTFSTGSSTPTTIIWRAFFFLPRPTSLWLRWAWSRNYPPSIRSISFWNQESKTTLSSTLRSWLRISNPIFGSIRALIRRGLYSRLFWGSFPARREERSAFWLT